MVKNVANADKEKTGVHSYPFGQLVPCPTCSEPARRKWLMSNCGLEGGMLHVGLNDWAAGQWADGRRIKQRIDARRAIETAVAQRHGLYTFFGDFGSGKTHALAVVCNELRGTLTETFYAPMPSILAHLRTLYGTKQDSSTFWERLLDIPVLALDEVTRINTTDWAREMLFVLVDTRYRRRASHLTLFATNDDPRQSLPTSETFGYLFSRMRQGTVIELRGDMREVVG